MATDQIETRCPKCGAWLPDCDGLGVLRHEACGYCSHASVTGGVCDLCRVVILTSSRPRPTVEPSPKMTIGGTLTDETGVVWLAVGWLFSMGRPYFRLVPMPPGETAGGYGRTWGIEPLIIRDVEVPRES